MPTTAEDGGAPFIPVVEKKKRRGKKGGKPNPAADTAPRTSYFTRESEKQAFRPGGKVARSPLKDARDLSGERVLTPED